MAEHIVALFEAESSADAAARDLEAAGVPASAIRRYKPSETGEVGIDAPRAGSVETTRSSGGFWAWLFGEEHTETTRATYDGEAELYERRARAGEVVLDVMVHDDAQIHQAVSILEAHHPAQMDEHTAEAAFPAAAPSTGTAGMTGVAPADTAFSTGSLTQPVAPTGGAAPAHPAATPDSLTPGSPAGTGATPAEPVTASRTASERDEVIPLAEEQLEVGKRTVDRGTTRVRRYVVETPVEREVTLQGERVTIERRRPVEGAGTPAGAFEERTVEVHETEEVPEVEKTARVVEEVAIRREATERTETVRDTVRREEVEVTGKGNPDTVPPKR